jgi:hypothetical protein
MVGVELVTFPELNPVTVAGTPPISSHLYEVVFEALNLNRH